MCVTGQLQSTQVSVLWLLLNIIYIRRFFRGNFMSFFFYNFPFHAVGLSVTFIPLLQHLSSYRLQCIGLPVSSKSTSISCQRRFKANNSHAAQAVSTPPAVTGSAPNGHYRLIALFALWALFITSHDRSSGPQICSPHFTPGPQSRSATFWSAVYPFAGPQVRSPHFTPGRT